MSRRGVGGAKKKTKTQPQLWNFRAINVITVGKKFPHGNNNV